jgi:integrase
MESRSTFGCESAIVSFRARGVNESDRAIWVFRVVEAEARLWKQNPQRLREVLAQGAERAKIARITPHALRHTYGTRWLQAGGDIYKLSKILGHSSVGVTEAHYAHLLKDDLVAASRQIKLPIANRRRDNIVAMQRNQA